MHRRSLGVKNRKLKYRKHACRVGAIWNALRSCRWPAGRLDSFARQRSQVLVTGYRFHHSRCFASTSSGANFELELEGWISEHLGARRPGELILELGTNRRRSSKFKPSNKTLRPGCAVSDLQTPPAFFPPLRIPMAVPWGKSSVSFRAG